MFQLKLILLADDDPVDRANIKKIAVSFGSIVDEAGTGQEVLELVGKKDYDCIILDHLLPDYDSTTLIPKIREKEIKVPTPIIIITGYGDELLAVQLMKSGASDYIPKDKLSPEMIISAMELAVNFHKNEGVALAQCEDNFKKLKEISDSAKTRVEEMDQATEN